MKPGIECKLLVNVQSTSNLYRFKQISSIMKFHYTSMVPTKHSSSPYWLTTMPKKSTKINSEIMKHQ